jgi:L-lactate dehydrogenase (cytochrome)
MLYTQAYNIDDLHRIARRRLPKVCYDFMAEGTEDNVALRNNREVFERIRLQPRMLVGVSKRTQQVTVHGKTFQSPFGIAPTGAAGLYGFDADVALARAAAKAGVPFVLSTASFVPLERITEEVPDGTNWFQLYMSKEREGAEKLITRARDANFEALVVTTDIPVAGGREYNKRNGFEVPFKMRLGSIIDGAMHPHWMFGVFLRTLLDSGVPRLQNVDANVGGRIVSKSMAEFRSKRDALNWSDMAWVRSIWPRKLYIKGIMTAADAREADRIGADGIFVSNHGGRQLDGAVSPMEVLPEIVAAVGGRLVIMTDSGFRRGTDIVKALALGANMVFLGRATLFGVAAGGEAGASRALDLLRGEVDRTMAQIGVNRVDDISRAHLVLDETMFTNI